MQTHEISEIAADGRLIEGENREFRERFNRTSFALSHRLSDHPLFELPQLLELAKIVDKDDLYYDSGDVQIGQRWDQVPACDMSVDQLIDRIENAGAWIFLRNVQKYPPYDRVLDRLLDEYLEMVDDPSKKWIRKREGILFITSPNRVAAYHIDRECSLLLQIKGEKTISVFDQDDRDVLPEQEIETFWAADSNAAKYKEHLQGRAVVYELKPTTGIHIPVNAPHWVKNHDNVSVSLNINFQFDGLVRANVYRANFYLRKLGLNPRPPGSLKMRDALKARTVALLLGCSRLARRALSSVKGRFRGRA